MHKDGQRAPARALGIFRSMKSHTLPSAAILELLNRARLLIRQRGHIVRAFRHAEHRRFAVCRLASPAHSFAVTKR